MYVYNFKVLSFYRIKTKECQKSELQREPKLTSAQIFMDNSAPTRFLVVDTAAFIKGVKLERIASEFYTVSEVFDEVRDRQARLTLQTFPFEIKVRQPHPADIKSSKYNYLYSFLVLLVIEFSKKTGDFYSLSNTDIKVLALTLTLEREANGIDHIRTEPLRQVEICIVQACNSLGERKYERILSSRQFKHYK